MRSRNTMRTVVALSYVVGVSLANWAKADEAASESTVRASTPAQKHASLTAGAADQPPSPPITLPTTDAPTHRAEVTAPAFPRPGIPSPAFTRPIVEPPVTNQTRQALDFYGGYSARATLSQLPRRSPVHVSATQPTYRASKPFNMVYQEPTVSPYLNLYREEDDSQGAPNYFAFVRPQLEQIEANRMQHREIQRLRGQLQGTPAAGGVPYQSTGTIGSRMPARYMDTAQFYNGLRR